MHFPDFFCPRLSRPSRRGKPTSRIQWWLPFLSTRFLLGNRTLGRLSSFLLDNSTHPRSGDLFSNSPPFQGEIAKGNDGCHPWLLLPTVEGENLPSAGHHQEKQRRVEGGMRLTPYHHLASLPTSPLFTIHTPHPLHPPISDWNSAAETVAFGRSDIASSGSQTTDNHISRHDFTRLTAWRQPCMPRTMHVEGPPP
jgi:hypothetical protein